MATFFRPPAPWPISRRLQPELFPPNVVAGSFTAGVGAGSIEWDGTIPSLNIGQVLGGGAGSIEWDGAPAALALGQVAGFNVGAGSITWFGNTVGVVTTDITPEPPVEATPAPFKPAISELGLDAWERCGIRAGQLTVQHLTSMRRSMNLVLVRWANNGINLWKVAAATITLRKDQASYVLPANLIDMLDTYLRRGAAPNFSDILITPMSRDTYAAISNKAQPGAPILYWFTRTVIPTVTVWPVPDADNTYSLPYFGWLQVPDADPVSGNTLDIPYRFTEAFTAGVAAHLAMKWMPARAVPLKAYADEVFVEAADADREKVTLNVSPDFSAYFR